MRVRNRWPSWAMTIVAIATAVTVATAQEKGSVRVTSAVANIRAAASETSQVLTQVKQDAVLELIAVEGDWFHVRVPVGIVRVEAYISKKVSKIDTPPAAAPGAKAPREREARRAAASADVARLDVGGADRRLELRTRYRCRRRGPSRLGTASTRCPSPPRRSRPATPFPRARAPRPRSPSPGFSMARHPPRSSPIADHRSS